MQRPSPHAELVGGLSVALSAPFYPFHTRPSPPCRTPPWLLTNTFLNLGARAVASYLSLQSKSEGGGGERETLEAKAKRTEGTIAAEYNHRGARGRENAG